VRHVARGDYTYTDQPTATAIRLDGNSCEAATAYGTMNSRSSCTDRFAVYTETAGYMSDPGPPASPPSPDGRDASAAAEADRSPTPMPPLRHFGWRLLAVMAIVIAAGSMRLVGLNDRGLWLDEFRQTSTYDGTLAEVIADSFAVQRQTSLDYVIGWALFKVSDADWAARLPSAVFGTAAVLVVYLLLSKLFCVRTALLGALMLAFSPLHIELSQEARPYTIFVFFYALALYALTVAWRRNDWKGWLGFGIAAELMLLSRSFGPAIAAASMVLAMVCVGLAGLKPELARGWRRARLVRFLVCSLVLATLYIPVVVTLAHHERQRAYSAVWGSLAGAEAAPGLGELLVQNADRWLMSLRQAIAPADQIKMVLLALGIVLTVWQWKRLATIQRGVLLSMPAAGAMYLVAYSMMVPSTAPKLQYFLFQSLTYCSFIALAVVWIIDAAAARIRTIPLVREAALGAVAVLIVVGGSHAYLDYRHTERRADWRGCARFLNDRLQDGDAIVVFTNVPFGQYQRKFVGQSYIENKNVVADSLWRFVYTRSYGQGVLRPQRGRVYLVLFHRTHGRLTRAELNGVGLLNPPPHMQLRKFARLDLLWFDGPPVGVRQDLIRIIDVLLGTNGPAIIDENSSGRAIPHALKARILGESGFFQAARNELTIARDMVQPEYLDYFMQNTGGLWRALSRDVPPGAIQKQ